MEHLTRIFQRDSLKTGPVVNQPVKIVGPGIYVEAAALTYLKFPMIRFLLVMRWIAISPDISLNVHWRYTRISIKNPGKPGSDSSANL